MKRLRIVQEAWIKLGGGRLRDKIEKSYILSPINCQSHTRMSDSQNFWIILKYLLLIHLYLSSHLHVAVAGNHDCDPNSFFKCKKSEECISNNFVCDGENDCGDMSDEQNCPEMSLFYNHNKEISKNDGCNEDSFQCLDGLCIPNHWVCDGSYDCVDHSDESLGCNNTVPCDDGFRCKSRNCIPKEWKCDRNDDCGDNSDEENCPIYDPSNCNIKNNQFLCNDKRRCLNLADVCNQIPNCADGSDEGGSCTNSDTCQPACINGHRCIKTPLKALCTCPPGHSDQNGFCKDVDECQEFGACDHKCVNTVGGYLCMCGKGFSLQSDKKSCKAEGGEGLLLFSSEHEIRAYFLDSKVYYPISKDIGHANGVAYDGHFVYWTNIGEQMETIVRAKEDGSEIEKIVDFGLGTPENLALDWITGNIYFTDSQMQHIGVCTKTGIWCMVLHKDGVDNPRAIALDPARGMLYWSDWGESVHSIVKSGMDGSNRENFVDKEIFWPNGITIDFGTDRLYWADANKKRIESILLDGTDRRIIVSEPVDNPFSITVFENKLYWSDWRGNQILSCNKFNGKNHSVVIKKHDSQIYNLYVYHSSVQSTQGPNPCSNNKCSHICLLSPLENNITCSCPQDMELSSDGKTCVKKHNYNAIYAASGHTVIEIKYDKIGKKHFEEYILNDIGVLGDMAYNAYSDAILLSDLYKHRITSFSRKTKQHSTIFESGKVSISKIDHDPIANNLYWIEGKTNSLNVISLNTMESVILIHNFGDDIPTDIELVPELGIMFISLHNNKGHCHIDKYLMDGSMRFHFIEKDLIGPIITLVFDPSLHRLFYADQGSGKIVSTSVGAYDKHVFREHLPGPIGLTIHGNYLFWVNYGSDKIYWANKYDGSAIDVTTNTGQKGVDKIKLLSLESYEIENNTTCHLNNGNCSHICLLKEKSQVCACPTGMILDRTGFKCISQIVCSEEQFKCASGECIRKDLICNRVEDCQSGDDELHCVFTTVPPKWEEPREPACPLDNFFCLDNSGCIPQSSVCDSINDCADASDEMHCGRDRTCSAAQFTCGSGECIPSSFRCDDRIDCSDHSDESDCTSNTCDPSIEFRCDSGNCIPLTWKCDRELDCPDASDERADCEYDDACSDEMFTCLNHKCVDKKLECNSFDDCGDNSDEVQCITDENINLEQSTDAEQTHRNIHMCNHTHFTCSGLSGSCIPLKARCNGTSECNYSEDELDCNECIYGFFECTTIKECIPEVWVCDGMPDCYDKTDEEETFCMHKQNNQELTSQNETVPCIGMECKDSKQCIPYSKICDKVFDCKDHSDEMGLCGVGCDGAGCSQICRESPSGSQCDCNEGYKLALDGRSCFDVNECSSHSTCSQHCHNTIGSFYCSCLTPYYQLRDDRRRCKATGKEMELVYLTGKDLRLTTESLSIVHVLHEFKTPSIIDGIDVHVKNNLLYWSSRYDGYIARLIISNPEKVIIKEGFDKVGSLAVDWITGNVYVVVEWNKVKLCDADISKCTDIYKAQSEVKITAIVLDPLTGWVFWSEMREGMGHSTSSLKRSQMSGRQVETILGEKASMIAISDLSFDGVNKWLYFTDLPGKSVGRVLYNGTKHEILFMVTEQPSNLGIFEDHIYLTSKIPKQSLISKKSKYGVIQKCGIQSNLYGECNYIRILPSTSNDVVKRLQILHQSLQIEGRNYCSDINCQGICVNSGSKAICICESGTLAPPDGSCPNLIKLVEGNTEDRMVSSSGHTGTIVCLLLVLLTLSGVLVAFKFTKLNGIPSYVCGKVGTKFNDLKNFTSQRYDNKRFKFNNLKNDFTEELIPENDEYSNPLIRDF